MCEDVFVELLGAELRHMSATMPVKNAKVNPKLVHGLVGRRSVPQLHLLARPALGVDTDANGFGSHIVAFPLLLQRLSARVDGQRLAVLPQHHDLEGSLLAVLLAQLVEDPGVLPQVDGIRVRAAHDIPQVHEDALRGLLALLHGQGHDEAEALLGVPLPDLPLDLLLPGRLLFAARLLHWLRLLRRDDLLRGRLRHADGLRLAPLPAPFAAAAAVLAARRGALAAAAAAAAPPGAGPPRGAPRVVAAARPAPGGGATEPREPRRLEPGVGGELRPRSEGGQ
mmetsp:Transcript_16956/g.45261  ORF Transcript_16956/g.45261 Transcript_16956/m.45261 type:complete len:282 (+) Transcript_16956:1346-2191(+)